MITAQKLRAIRRKTHWPNGAHDKPLARLAKKAFDEGRGHYETGRQENTQVIYRYLSDFVTRVMLEHTGRLPEEITILDWGGGKGYVTYFLQRNKLDVELFETADFPHKDVWKAYDLKVTTSNAGTLPYADGTFDAVVGFGVLEHVPYDYDALKEVNRILKNDGLFMCFNLPNRLGYLHYIAAKRGVRYHDRLYGSKETRQLLKRAGFNTVGKPWRRQLFPKNAVQFKHWRQWEQADLLLCRYTPLCLFATSLEFVARKQYTYTSIH